MSATATQINEADILDRLAVDLDVNPAPFEAEAAAVLTDLARSAPLTENLVDIMNDEGNTHPVRTRAMTRLTAELIRAHTLVMQ